MSGPSDMKVAAATAADHSGTKAAPTLVTLKQDLKARLLALPREDEPLGTHRNRDHTPPLSVVAKRRLLHSLLGAQCAEERSCGSSASDRFHAWSTQAAKSLSYEDSYEDSCEESSSSWTDSSQSSTVPTAAALAVQNAPASSFVLHSGIKVQPKRH